MRHSVTLLVVCLLAIGVQTWCIAHAVVPAQDTIRYVAIAQSIGQAGLAATWQEHAEHPLFPVIVYGFERTIVASSGGPSASWGLAAQLAASTMLVLSIIPIYGLLLRLLEWRAALAGTVLFCLMSELARLGADGLSDSSHLFFVCVALWSLACYWGTTPAAGAVRIAHSPRPLWLLLTGVSLGLAMLARPEALAIVATLGLAMAAFQLRGSLRQSWLKLSAGLACLALGVAFVVGPYLWLADACRPRTAVSRLLGRDAPNATATPPSNPSLGKPPGRAWRLFDGERMTFGIKDRSVSTRFNGYPAAIAEYFHELTSVLQYWIGGLAALGLFLRRHHPRGAFEYFALLLFVVHSLAAVWLAAKLGYLSARHLLTLAVLALAPAAAGACDIGRLLAERLNRVSLPLLARQLRRPEFGSALIVSIAAIACLPETMAPLHASRSGHRRAGAWLAESTVSGAVLDTRGWTALYSGRTTYRYDAAKAAYSHPELAYIVVEQRDLELDSPRARTLKHLLSGAAEQVAAFAAPRGKPDDTVLVYRWHAARFTDRLRTALPPG